MTAEQIAKINWLNRAFHAEKAVRAWIAKEERDRSLAERLSGVPPEAGASQCPAGKGRRGAGNVTEECLIHLAETTERTQEALRELVRIREEVTDAIGQVKEPDLQAVLVWHYLAYEPWEAVAERMHYSVRAVKYKHKIALDCIVLHPEMCYTDTMGT